MTTDDEQIDLLANYDRWKTNQIQKDPDTSPQAFLAMRRFNRQLAAMEASMAAALDAVELLEREVQGAKEGSSRRDALESALVVCRAVTDGGGE
jgi:hypothetical protein